MPVLLAGLRHAPGAVVADNAYDTNAVLAAIACRHAEPVIPPKSSRNERRAYDQNLYAERNEAERFFGRLKEARGFAYIPPVNFVRATVKPDGQVESATALAE
ncbi:transposase [Hymenobacter perfusus]|uniref:Transposase IS4-like domain-containing protein n=1 Tax=Hymenobacter perfusus TaxID=1236770 RepID=A0A3R9N6D3_9BACT|nr:transposase [Hymenobacter perfusus]RSK40032.1 hypothetical protein EI293_18840 [Hymenobacter perfusus]